MAAGSVAGPTIIPLRISRGFKHVIDSATKIELASDTPNTVVFFTLNGSKPCPTHKNRHLDTYKYREPFTLSSGKVTVRAMACSRDMSKQSCIVTKAFTVLQATASSGSDNSEEEEEEEEEVPVSARYKSPSQPPSISAQLQHRLTMSSRSGKEVFRGSPSPEPLSVMSCSVQRSRPRDKSPGQASVWSSGRVSVKLSGQASVKSSGQASVKSLGQASVKSFGQASMKSSGQTSVKSVGQSSAMSVETTISRPATVEIPKPLCLFCGSPRSENSSHCFCYHCGSRLPPLPEVDPVPPLQVSVCTNCNAHVPLDSTLCVVCEHTVLQPSPIPIIQAQASTEHMMKDKVMCLVCGTRNRPDNVHCLTCEKPLPPEPAPPPHPSHSPPLMATPTTMRPVSGSSYVMCSTCGRVNVSDARFCDWCGSKPEVSTLLVQCVNCSTAVEWHHRYCAYCGNIVKAPLRPEVELSSTMKMPAGVEFDKNAWVPVVEIADEGPQMEPKGTQTDGIFYPSARTIGNQKGSEFVKKMIRATARDRMPKLNGFSPGRGLWRMQVEHVCSHLRAHAQSSNDFQFAIGMPQFGKLRSAEVQENKNSEVDINLTFALKQTGTHDDDDSAPLRRAASCNSITTTAISQTTHTQTAPIKSILKSQHSRQRRRSHSVSLSRGKELSGETKRLYKELVQGGLGRKEILNMCILKGADVNACVPESGLPILSLAASNNHFDCISILVRNGARVNQQARATGNTALHEAVLKGPHCIPSIEALLGQGADAKQRNAQGLTPCDLAIQLKHDQIVSCFATYVGAGLLDNLYKYQPSLTL